MLALRCTQPYPCIVAWNGAQSSMSPAKRADSLLIDKLEPLPFSYMVGHPIYTSRNFLYFNSDGITYYIPLILGVINPDNFEPSEFHGAGSTEVFTPTYNPELPDSMQDLTPVEHTYNFTEVGYDETVVSPFQPQPFSISMPNVHVLEGDWTVPAFTAGEHKLNLVVGVIPPWPFALVPFLQGFSGIEYGQELPFLSASEVSFQFVNRLLYTPYFLLGYEITFSPPDESLSQPSFSVVSKVWNQYVSNPEDDDEKSFFCNLLFDLPIPGRPAGIPFKREARTFRDRFLVSYTFALDQVKPELIFLDRPEQPHLYDIYNPCT